MKMLPLTLYRNIIKNMKYYPSKKRFNLLLAAKEGINSNIFIKILTLLIKYLVLFIYLINKNILINIEFR